VAWQQEKAREDLGDHGGWEDVLRVVGVSEREGRKEGRVVIV